MNTIDRRGAVCVLGRTPVRVVQVKRGYVTYVSLATGSAYTTTVEGFEGAHERTVRRTGQIPR